jgi:hypothetical protein
VHGVTTKLTDALKTRANLAHLLDARAASVSCLPAIIAQSIMTGSHIVADTILMDLDSKGVSVCRDHAVEKRGQNHINKKTRLGDMQTKTTDVRVLIPPPTNMQFDASWHELASCLEDGKRWNADEMGKLLLCLCHVLWGPHVCVDDANRLMLWVILWADKCKHILTRWWSSTCDDVCVETVTPIQKVAVAARLSGFLHPDAWTMKACIRYNIMMRALHMIHELVTRRVIVVEHTIVPETFPVDRIAEDPAGTVAVWFKTRLNSISRLHTGVHPV